MVWGALFVGGGVDTGPSQLSSILCNRRSDAVVPNQSLRGLVRSHPSWWGKASLQLHFQFKSLKRALTGYFRGLALSKMLSKLLP